MNYCPNCGSSLKDNPIYCPNCGQKLVQTVNQVGEQKSENKQIEAEMKEARNNEIGAAVAGALLIIAGIIFIGQRVFSVDAFDMRVVFIDKGAIGGVIAVLLGIACCVAGERYGNKYKELKKKL